MIFNEQKSLSKYFEAAHNLFKSMHLIYNQTKIISDMMRRIVRLIMKKMINVEKIITTTIIIIVVMMNLM